MLCADFQNLDLHNAYFEGYKKQVEVTNLFLWNFKGELIHAAMNFSGSWHDSILATVSGLYHGPYHYCLSDESTPAQMAFLAHSAFVTSTKTTNGKIVHTRKTNETKSIPASAYLAGLELVLQRVYPSERQSGQWGVRALKETVPLLKVQLPAEANKIIRLIAPCCHFLTLRPILLASTRSVQSIPGLNTQHKE